ncbi:MAG: hypothetical protein P0Y53_15075 [Candidatus Pseudobacter hemicellulosilyticus]|uniref:Uncharacterized protein n=1 Tax=Candidatus Pseudobacter hemicellulosilyticus TaxID=3121375 RepID=A0AAJ6BEA8_9BACT|nr:MAG: hypothetical protein P0Y53_15075 [Pseudobacter sp.]
MKQCWQQQARLTRLCWLLLSLMPVTRLLAQPSEDQRIEDSVIGWYNKLTPADKPVKPLVFGTETFSLKEQENNNLLVQWMQQSYVPVGAIGKFDKHYYYNKKEAYPHSYGVFFRAYNVGFKWLDAQKKFRPIPEEWVPFTVSVNTVPATYPAYYLNTQDSYYFTMEPNGFMETLQSQRKMKKLDPRIHPNLYPYLTHISSYRGTVYLIPGNKLPIIPLTKGEYLQLSYDAMDRHLVSFKKELQQKYASDPRNIDDFYAAEVKRIAKYKAVIRQLQEKHQGDKDEPAVLRSRQPSIHDLDGLIDPFHIDKLEQELNHAYTIYRFDPAVYAQAKAGKPLWVTINFPIATSEDGRKGYELTRCMMEHFNYQYVYDYFFQPEKVKGQAYKPANEELLKATLARYGKREYWEGKATAEVKPVDAKPSAAGVLLQDDLSSNTPGERPAGWFFSAYGKPAVVREVSGYPGKWMQLGYNNVVTSTRLKMPLPENFTIRFELLTDDFSGPTGGAIRLKLQGKAPGTDPKRASASIDLLVVSGNNDNLVSTHNYRGLLQLGLRGYPANYSGNANPGDFSLAQAAFNNKKRKVQLTLQKKGGETILFIDGKEIVRSGAVKDPYGYDCKLCSIPQGVLFDKLEIKSATQDAETVGVYLGNVVITKE